MVVCRTYMYAWLTLKSLWFSNSPICTWLMYCVCLQCSTRGKATNDKTNSCSSWAEESWFTRFLWWYCKHQCSRRAGYRGPQSKQCSSASHLFHQARDVSHPPGSVGLFFRVDTPDRGRLCATDSQRCRSSHEWVLWAPGKATRCWHNYENGFIGFYKRFDPTHIPVSVHGSMLVFWFFFFSYCIL